MPLIMNMKKEVVRLLLFFSARSSLVIILFPDNARSRDQNDTVETEWLGIWDFAPSNIFSWSLTYQTFFLTSGQFFTLKTFHSKLVVTAFKNVLPSKPL